MEKIIKPPLHLGIILDGNRRWAKEQGRPSLEGHRRGLDNIRTIARHCFKKGIRILTVFAFSTENWGRERKEVAYLLKLFHIFVRREVAVLAKSGVKIKFFGRLIDFDTAMRREMEQAERATAAGSAGQLNICLSYGGRDEIVRAVRKLIKAKTPAGKITEELLSQKMDSAGLPDPDLIIRTSGEQRLSGFLAWQGVYSELLFVRKHWPAFSPRDLDAALREYAKRERRFGGR